MAAKMVGEALLGSVKFVGEALVGSAVEMLLGRLASQDFIDFFRGRKHNEGLLKKLELTLLELNKLLNDAENRQLTDLVVRRWLDELKDAIYHAEDLLDEITYEALRSKVEAEYPGGKKRLRDAAISTFTSFFDSELVASLSRTTSIRELLLEECQGVQLEWQGMSFVEKLKMSGFESLKEFESALITLTNLKKLEVSTCSILSLPEIGFPLKLTSLFVEDCGAMQCFPGGMMCLVNLKHLRVDRCPELVLPLPRETSHCNMSLERLSLYCCESLKSLPLGLFPKLRSLTIDECINFETLLIPDGIENQNLTLLEHLAISNCNNMVSFPCGGIPAPQLSNLWIFDCKKLKALPEQMHTLLPSLQSLQLKDCPEIESLPEGGLPSKLCSLDIMNCEKLVGDRRNWGLQRLTSLRYLSLSDRVVESFPEEGLLPSTLTRLRVGIMQNLKALNGRGLQRLVSLKRMRIRSCPQLQSLPEEGLPTSLFALSISRCPLLKPRCLREGGEDCHKVAHVPLIMMDDEVIFDKVHLRTADPWECLETVFSQQEQGNPMIPNGGNYQQSFSSTCRISASTTASNVCSIPTTSSSTGGRNLCTPPVTPQTSSPQCVLICILHHQLSNRTSWWWFTWPNSISSSIWT
ncbi:hypothetical protein Vadar_030634 [Vaccinium darrowii]|uniref:Uncharacterized protein n=1 Tax=Vaccinium darrowii TaxID=229202 RepID=A0ACB7Z0N1_9ERIC|nr:hypothetical protein Vadar_030634 [Vaccinium darrowii]